MIKCNVSLCGTISRNAMMKNGKNGQYVNFLVKVPLKGNDGQELALDVSVSIDADKSAAAVYVAGRKVAIEGTLTFRKVGEVVYVNLKADRDKVQLAASNAPEKIEGTMTFTGKTGSKPAAPHTDKNGNQFVTFSAFSSDRNKNGGFEYLWVHFLNFNPCDLNIVAPKSLIQVEGEMQLGVYKGRMDIGCRVNTLQPFVKQPASY